MKEVRPFDLCVFTILLLSVVIGVLPAVSYSHEGPRVPVFDAPPSVAKTAETEFSSDRQLNPIHMLVVFTRFKGEEPLDNRVPEWAPNLFDGKKGSVTHYFDEISHGTICVTGEYFPRCLELPHQKSFYKSNDKQYTYDVLDILDKDEDFNYAQYDNDGPDGIPGSRDDDGYLDFVALMPLSLPDDFIRGSADGLASLPLTGEYYTSDRIATNVTVKVDARSGILSQSSVFHKAVGLICHEYIHKWGCWDLYDTSWDNDAHDSAGIGFWGVMGRGIMGWNWEGGPVGPCAYTRMVMGIIGFNNDHLMDLYGAHRGVHIKDLGTAGGQVYRIWAADREYFLLEYRSKSTLFCDRNLPGEGLLIWHVNERGVNTNELNKLCDLECADGLYEDYGYPKGLIPSPEEGLDNLDYWAHTPAYCETYVGNLGDITDIFDGVQYKNFSHATNPNTITAGNGMATGVEITNIKRVGGGITFDVVAPVYANNSYHDDIIQEPIDWYHDVPNLIGLGFQRFIPASQDSLSSAAKPAMYIMKRPGNVSSDGVLVTVRSDSVFVDTLGELDYIDAHRLVEWRSGGISQSGGAYSIRRENITSDEFNDTMSDLGFDPGALCPGEDFTCIQKIVLDASEESHPEEIALYQNYPNPFNAWTTIRFDLPHDGAVTVALYSVLGQKVLSRDCGYLSQGTHQVSIDAEGLASGLYLYRITSGTMSNTRKMVLLK